jgi:hypothetical protein
VKAKAGGENGVVAKYMMDETELVKHAIAAYCHGPFVMRQGFQRPGEDSTVEKHDGKRYVVLRNAGQAESQAKRKSPALALGAGPQ